ncbi:MAG: RNA polymerase sigma factor [Lachnospiraceae bacterium]|nr:RNA polymerase sigma factor [Lachnospiraceae bacterium]
MGTTYDNTCTEQMLVKLSQEGDRKAFAKLYETVYMDLYRFALYTMKHPQDAEDVVSETIILAYENMCKLRKTEAFRSWIFKILVNNCKRKWIHEKEKVLELKEEDAISDVDMGEVKDIKDAFAKLEKEERYIIALSVFGGYNSAEIGRMVKLNRNTVRSKLSRGLEKMGHKLGS